MLRQLARSNITRRWFATTTAPKQAVSLEYNGTTYPYRWLRDSCQCPECVHPSTRQKLFKTTDIPEDTTPTQNGVETSSAGIGIQWASGHRSFYPSDLLKSHSTSSQLHQFHKDFDPVSWDAKKIEAAPNLFVPYDALETKPGLLRAVEQIIQYGLLFITGVPNQETSNEDCELRTLAKKFSGIRDTLYGETWDVKNVRNSRNIAYTNLDLGLHMDLMYFQHPPRFQLLHCLRNKVEGGTSLFVDALAAAEELRQTHPEDFDLLTETPVTFHYINDGHHLHRSHPTIELDPIPTPDGSPRPIRHINYSPPFQAPFSLSTPAAFYPAFERYVSLLDRPSARYDYLLKEGDTVVFDNRRVLHARTAFTDKEGVSEDEVNRWLKGCYIEADAVMDRGRVLRGALSA